MDDVLYQRPREKLISKGVSQLSLVELLQVILGSGNSTASAASMAQQVAKLIAHETASYKSLIAIEGIGNAKACQLLASIELAARLSVRE